MKAHTQLLTTLLALTACGSAPTPVVPPNVDEPAERVSIYDTPVDKEDPTAVGTTTTTSASAAQTTTTSSSTAAVAQGMNAADTDGSGGAARSGASTVVRQTAMRPFTAPPINTGDPCGACNRQR
jgi:hypothetical protein